MAKTNEQVVRSGVEALVAGNMEAFTALLADDIVVHVPGTNQLSGEYKSKDEALGSFFSKVMGLSGGTFALLPHDVLGSNEHAVGIYNIKATRDGKTFEWRHVNVYHVSDGKISEVWQHPGDFEAWNKFWS